MKRRTCGPKKAVSRRKWYPGIFLNAYLGKKTRPPVKQRVVLRRVVAEVRDLLVPAIAVATEDESFARVIVPAFEGRDRLFVNG